MVIKNKWLPLFITNYLGVFNDNLLKNLASFIAIAWVAKTKSTQFLSMAAAMLVIPYILFSPLAGMITRSSKKTNVIRLFKLLEIPIISIGCLGFVYQNVFLVLASIFLMGWQSCMYSPSKYAIIRDIGGVEKISFGTGSLEMFTFLGILTGTAFAAFLSDYFSNPLWLSAIMLTIAGAGFVASLSIKATESDVEKKDWKHIDPVSFFIKSFRYARTIKGLNNVILGLGVFWLIGTLLQLNLYKYCPEQLMLNNSYTGLVMTITALGIGMGCYIAGVASKNHISLHLVLIGSMGMVVNILLILLVRQTAVVFSILIFFTAFFSGFYKVPLNAWLQEKVKGRAIGDILAYQNTIEFLFILVGAATFNYVYSNWGSMAIFFTIICVVVATSVILISVLPNILKDFVKMWKN